MTMSITDPRPCGCLDRCRQEGFDAFHSMQSLASGGAYCRKSKGERFKHRLMSNMEIHQLEAARRQDEHAAKELSIAESNLRDANERRQFAAEVLNHWNKATALSEAGEQK